MGSGDAGSVWLPVTGRVDVPSVRLSTAPAPRPGGADLLVAKLAPPQLPPGLVVRTRLVDQLDKGAASQVTLVSAGPGWGKTMLVAGWAASRSARVPVAWLSLDSDDNDPALFWSYVLAAVQGAVGELGPRLQGLAIRPPLGPETLHRIILGLTELQPLVLVLDDFSEVQSGEVLAGLGALLRHRSSLRVVLVTRADPLLRLNRLRVSGRLSEIRAADLAFTSAEALELLRKSGVPIATEHYERLLERTEGWAAGLRLAALSSDRSDLVGQLASPGWYEGTVAEYLLEEVLTRLSEQRRRFLLRTSVADKLTGELADVLSDGAGGQRELERLEQANAFVVALDADRHWFRYHRLMSELLQHRLWLEDANLVLDLQDRAARWFATRGDALAALRHAVRARDWQLVGDLVVSLAASRVVSNQRSSFAALLAKIPASEFSTSAELRACGALMRFLDRDYPGFAAQVVEARAMLNGRDPSGTQPVEVFLTAADMVLARARGDIDALLSASEQLLAWLAEPGTSTLHAVARQYEAPALNNRGVALVWSGRESEAEPYLRSAVDVAAATGADLTMVNSHAYLGLVELARGRLGAAAAAAGDGLELAEQRGGTELAQAIVVYVVLAEVHLQRNDLDVAQVFVNRGLAAQRNDPEWTPYVALRALQARLLILAGQPNQAETVISALKAERGDWIAPARLRHRLAAIEAEIRLAQGRPADALDGLRPYLAEDGPVQEELSICAARAELAMGEVARVEERLAPMRGAAKSPVTEVWAWLITALAADSRRDDHRAVDAVDSALIAAEPEGIVRPFVGLDDARVQAILRHRQGLGRTGRYAATIMSQFEPSPSRTVAAPPADPLTDRELVVLSHLALLETNDEIAAALYISVNTVKAHAKSVFRKLDVSSRREAVKRGRALGLISSG